MDEKRRIYYNYFENKILQEVKPLENYRKKTVFKLVWVSLLFFLGGLAFAGLFLYNSVNNIFNPLILPVLLFLMYAFILKSIVDIIVTGKEYRKKLVREVLPLFFKPVANFKNWPYNDVEAVINSGLFPNFDTREDSLSFFGHYNGSNIIVSETKLTLPIKNADKQNLFKGTLIQLELPKTIDNHIILLSQNEVIHNRLNRVKSGIKDFDSEAFMFAKKDTKFFNETLWGIVKRFGKAYLAKGFGLSCNENILLIAVRQKNPMQFGSLFKSLLKPENYDELIDRFIVIYDLIDCLGF